MLRGIRIGVISVFMCASMKAQINIVINPSFEDTIACPLTGGDFEGYVYGWQGGFGSYFNSFCQGFNIEVPLNGFGYQYPRTGNAYAGIYCIEVDNVPAHENQRDYIEGALIDTLVLNRKYCVSFYVSAADNCKYVGPIGFLFSNDTLSYDWYWLGLIPDYTDTGISALSDTANWTLVSTIYAASGGERFISIGNHLNDTVSPYLFTNPTGNNTGGFYFVDDVAVTPYLEAVCRTDTGLCVEDSISLGMWSDSGVVYTWSPSIGLSDSTSPNPWAKPLITTTYYLTISDTGNLYCTGNLVDSVTITVNDCTPVPSLNVPTLLSGNELFYITSLPANSTLKVFDMRGRLVLNEENYQNDFSVVKLDAAVYIYELTLPDLTVQSGKFCVVK